MNPDKQLWYCDPCASGGDVIRFIEIAEKVSFKEALSILGIDTKPNYRPIVTAAQRRAAESAAAWMREQRRKINLLLGDVLEQIDLADDIHDIELAESFLRERSFAATFTRTWTSRAMLRTSYRSGPRLKRLPRGSSYDLRRDRPRQSRYC